MVDWSAARVNTVTPLVNPDDEGHVVRLDELLAGGPRPFVLMSEREISVLRRGLTKDGWKRSLYLQPAEGLQSVYTGAGIMSVANRSLEMDTTIPARGGHYHKFFCDCGNRLTIPENLKLMSQYQCSACGKSYSGEDFDGAVLYMQHQRLAGAALSLSIVYGIEKDRAYSDKAAEILVNYARAYPGPHTDSTTGGILYQSLCEAVWVIPLAQAYDLIYYSRSLSDADRQLIENQLFRRVADGLRSVGIEGNWGSWHLSAVGVIGLSIKDAEFVNYALESLASQLTNQLGEDGLWPESVHTYHFYPLRAFVHLAEGCYRLGIDLYNWEPSPGKSLKAMFAAPLQYMYPSFRLPAINDGWYDSFLPLDLYEIANRRWDDPAFAWVLKRGYRFGENPLNDDQREHIHAFRRSSFFAFLFGRDLPGRSGVPVFKSHNFKRMGICTLRNDDDVMVTFDYGPFLGHGHLDKLSFTLYANNNLLVPDYGTPGYGSSILGWYTSTASHNTVVVDCKPQQKATEYGLTRHYSGAFLQIAEAKASDHYPGVVQTRRILLVGRWCFVIDLLESDDEHDYDWLIRCEGSPEPAERYESWDADCSKYAEIKPTKAYRFFDSCRFDWTCKEGNLATVMWTHGAPAELMIGTCPAETAERRVPLYLCRQRGKAVRFTAVLAPSQHKNLDVSKDGCVIRIAEDDCVDHIYLKDGDNALSGSLLQTDGEAAVVRTRAGEIQAFALFNGSWIRWMDELLIECPSTADCVEVSFGERNPHIRYCCDTAGVMKLRTNARAIRVNGHKAAAANSEGQALLRVTSQMLISMEADYLS